jgi:hypothetical protein
MKPLTGGWSAKKGRHNGPVVPAHTNSVGVFTKLETISVDRKVTGPSGNLISYTPVFKAGQARQAYSGKSPTIKTHVRFVNGKPFRDPTNYGRTVERYTYAKGYRSEPSGINTATYYGCWFDASHLLDHAMVQPSLGILNTDAKNQARTEALLKLNKRKVSYGQYLVESHKSAKMLATAGKELLTLLRHVKHGRIKQIPKDFGVIRRKTGEYWLQYQYGWQPLVSDIHGMWQVSRDGLQYPQLIRVVREVKSHYSDHGPHRDYLYNVEINHSDKCVLYAKLGNQFLAWAQNAQVINPASLGWEVIPYSFVLDWFVPVGNYLDALTATAGLDFVSGMASQRRQAVFSLYGGLSVGVAQKDVFIFVREKLTSFPSGRIYAVQNPFNLNRSLNLAALISQWFK